jgi:hypothetical protein
MKSLLYILYLIVFVSMVGCNNLEYIPTDQLSDKLIDTNPQLLKNVTFGTYSRLRSSNYVVNRHYAQQLPADESVLVKSTGNNYMYSYNYQPLVTSNVSTQFWREAYYGIYSANKVIEAINDNASSEYLQLKGENLFLRALMHYDLVRIFSRPYTQSPETNLGVMIRDNTDVNALPARSTVKATYDFIVKDLLKAADLMNTRKSAILASKETAWALLSRVYLYMEQNDKALEYADKVINSGRYSLIPTDKFGSYFTILPENNTETIFAIKLMESENMGKNSIGAMYELDGGWGENYASPPYRKLIYKNANDQRIKFINPYYSLDGNGNKIPDPTEECGFKVIKRNDLSQYFIDKYTKESGIIMLSSPVVIRLAEMYLIKAEVDAKTGKNAEAIDMVNTIRKRAGLSGDQLFTIGNLKGYSSVLDVVLDERFLELAWEGHRSFDLFRNNRPVDRTYVPAQAWCGPKDLIQPTSKLIVHLIPDAEMTLNPNLVQNPQ